MTPASKSDRTQSEPGRYLFYEWKNVAVIVWLASADGRAARCMTQFTDRIIRDWKAFSVIHVIEESAGMPSREGRDGFVETGLAHKGHLVCAGALLPHTGVLATLMRAFVRGVSTLMRGSVEVQIEQAAAPLASWMAPRHSERTGVHVSALQFEECIAEARKRAAAGMQTRSDPQLS
jgi:hypothetical protein